MPAIAARDPIARIAGKPAPTGRAESLLLYSGQIHCGSRLAGDSSTATQPPESLASQLPQGGQSPCFYIQDKFTVGAGLPAIAAPRPDRLNRWQASSHRVGRVPAFIFRTNPLWEPACRRCGSIQASYSQRVVQACYWIWSGLTITQFLSAVTGNPSLACAAAFLAIMPSSWVMYLSLRLIHR